MYDSNMIKDFENKFQSAALVELIKDPLNMLLVPQCLDSWRAIDEFLTAEKEAYDLQYKERLKQLEVTIPIIVTARDSAGSWLKLAALALGGIAVGGYIFYQFTPSGAAKRAEARTKKIIAKSKARVAKVKAMNEEKLEMAKYQKELRSLNLDNGGSEQSQRSKGNDGDSEQRQKQRKVHEMASKPDPESTPYPNRANIQKGVISDLFLKIKL